MLKRREAPPARRCLLGVTVLRADTPAHLAVDHAVATATSAPTPRLRHPSMAAPWQAVTVVTEKYSSM